MMEGRLRRVIRVAEGVDGGMEKSGVNSLDMRTFEAKILSFCLTTSVGGVKNWLLIWMVLFFYSSVLIFNSLI
jgi:hypothetical protein